MGAQWKNAQVLWKKETCGVNNTLVEESSKDVARGRLVLWLRLRASNGTLGKSLNLFCVLVPHLLYGDDDACSLCPVNLDCKLCRTETASHYGYGLVFTPEKEKICSLE